MTACTVCQARTATALCNRCTGQLEKALAELPALLCELDVTITRQDRGTGAALYAMGRRRLQLPGLHYDEGTTTLVATPWTFSWDAADLRWRVESTVHTWARHIAEARGLLPEPPTRPPGPRCPRVAAGPTLCRHASCGWRALVETEIDRVHAARERTLDTLARPDAFLLANLDAIRLDEAAADIHDEITACRHDLTRAIDRQEPDLFAGRCDARVITLANLEAALLTPELAVCGADLYARTGDADVKCPDCGTVYDLIAQRRHLDVLKLDAPATPKLIADALSTEEQTINASTLRTWINRDARLVERVKEGPVCAPTLRGAEWIPCGHRSCVALRAGHLALIVKLQGRPLILRHGWNAAGESVYRAGDVQARLAWNAAQKQARIGA